jgi:hypothetical protein
LSDERWALNEPVIASWKAAHRSVSGHEGKYAMREIVNAILSSGDRRGLLGLVAGAGLGEAVGVCADLDDVAAVGEPVDDGPRTSAGR